MSGFSVTRTTAVIGLLALVVSACTGRSPKDDAAPATTTPAIDARSTTATAPPSTVESDGRGCSEDDAEPGQTTVELDFEGQNRTYELYVPQGYDGAERAPLVLNWHGLGSTGKQQLDFSEYRLTADAGQFFVVAPTGLPSPGDTRNSWELTDDADPGRDDLAFAHALLDDVSDRVCVDPARIYTTGMSNGGYFSARLVCEMADRVAAAASVAGMTREDDCEPSRPVPYLAFHGVEDEIVPYAGGGYSSLAPGVYLELMDRSIPDEFAEFATEFGCDVEPASTEVAEGVSSSTYGGCEEDVELVLYTIADAGHTWPGSRTSKLLSEGAGLGTTTLEISATELSWEFFSRHRLR